MAEEMANGGLNLQNGRDHYFHYPLVDILPCAQTLLARLRIGTEAQPYCEDCLVLLSVRHLLVECPSLIELRNRYLYRCRGRDSGVYYLSKVLGAECLAQGHDVFMFFGRSCSSPKFVSIILFHDMYFCFI
ncbi:hypothetical protein E2C01_093929 [Portunus trituberculatus]|uniref:Uncharacterized protein n=1 Tax=Portunus trituberculatus TaxID=210409 RepID=A0A5B7JVJ7_PORTR|nr:hypothetical protein [Portunus trituberculatus]